MYPAFVPLLGCDIIEAKFYKLETSTSVIATFQPQPVPIVELPEFREYVKFSLALPQEREWCPPGSLRATKIQGAALRPKEKVGSYPMAISQLRERSPM